MGLKTAMSRIRQQWKESRLGKAKKRLEDWYAENTPTGEQKVEIQKLRDRFEKESQAVFAAYEERKNDIVCQTIEEEFNILSRK